MRIDFPNMTSSPKQDPCAPPVTTDNVVKKEAVCCFCPLRPCTLILILLMVPLVSLAIYSAFFDSQYVYVIVSYGLPSICGNSTQRNWTLGNNNDLKTNGHINSDLDGGEKIFYLPFENHVAHSGEDASTSDHRGNSFKSSIKFFLVDFPYYYRWIFYGDSEEENDKGSTEDRIGNEKVEKIKGEGVGGLNDNKKAVEEKDNSIQNSNVGSNTVVDHKEQVPTSETKALAVINPFQERNFMYDEIDFNIPNPSVCDNFGQNVTMIIGIHSYCIDFDRRRAIRETWAQLANDKYYKHVFFVGFPLSNDVMNRLMHESHENRDIIQTSLVEGADTEAAQTVMFLKWVSKECPKTKWVIKTEDDVFLNLPLAMYSLSKYVSKENETLERTMYGFVDTGEENPLIRGHHEHPENNHDANSVVKVDEKDQKHNPVFIGGAGYILPGFLASELYNAAKEGPTIQYESLFITGILSERLGISLTDIPWFDASVLTDIPRNDPCSVFSVSVIIHPLTASDIRDLWRILQKKNFDCGNFKYLAGKMNSDIGKLMYSSSLNNPKLNLN